MEVSNTVFLPVSLADFTKIIDDAVNERISKLIDEKIAPLVESKRHISMPEGLEEEYMTRQEVKKSLGISFPTLSRWSTNGKLKAFTIGRKVLYRKTDVYAMLEPLVTKSN